MKNYLWCLAAAAAVAIGPANAADIQYKPIDTQKLVVQPSNVAAGLAAKTINMAGQAAAGTIAQNGYVQTINNLFSKKIWLNKTQAGPSALPTPTMFSSTQYKSHNSPVMPAMQSVRR